MLSEDVSLSLSAMAWLAILRTVRLLNAGDGKHWALVVFGSDGTMDELVSNCGVANIRLTCRRPVCKHEELLVSFPGGFAYDIVHDDTSVLLLICGLLYGV
jgi:hypothetical protein